MGQGAAYSFVTIWEVRAPLERVWEAVFDSERWPRWWKGVERVTLLEPATGPNGEGALRRYTWKSRLPYRLSFDLRVTRVQPGQLIESSATGELEGVGRWTFLRYSSGITVRYDWSVRTTKAWMNLLAPLARPLFRWNHDAVMRQGHRGLAALLEGSGGGTV